MLDGGSRVNGLHTFKLAAGLRLSESSILDRYCCPSAARDYDLVLYRLRILVYGEI